MGEVAQANDCRFIISAGDNFYSNDGWRCPISPLYVSLETCFGPAASSMEHDRQAIPWDSRVARTIISSVVVVGLLSCAAGAASAQPFHTHDHREAAAPSAGSAVHRVNIIDGADERDSLLAIGPALGLSPEEIARIRKVSGYVGCFLPTPSVGAGALFLSNRQILTAGHIFFDPSGRRRSSCFFKNQAESIKIDLLAGPGDAVFGGEPPRPGSNDDYAIVRLAEPVADAEPFPVEPRVPVAAGDALVVVTAHPVGMAKEVHTSIPVAQPCRVRRAPLSTAATSFYRTDCDATGSSSGGMHLARIGGRLVFRGITITTGPWRDGSLSGAPYDERAGSVTTALGTDAAILAAGARLAAGDI